MATTTKTINPLQKKLTALRKRLKNSKKSSASDFHRVVEFYREVIESDRCSDKTRALVRFKTTAIDFPEYYDAAMMVVDGEYSESDIFRCISIVPALNRLYRLAKQPFPKEIDAVIRASIGRRNQGKLYNGMKDDLFACCISSLRIPIRKKSIPRGATISTISRSCDFLTFDSYRKITQRQRNEFLTTIERGVFPRSNLSNSRGCFYMYPKKKALALISSPTPLKIKVDVFYAVMFKSWGLDGSTTNGAKVHAYSHNHQVILRIPGVGDRVYSPI